LPSSLEIEVKLTGAAKALAKAWRGEALEGDPASEEVSKSLENVYFDTPDLRLRKLGYAFRIRKDGKRLVQTLKSKDVGGKAIARRREWSSVVTGLTPDVEKIGDKDIRHDIGELAPGDLVPIFTTKVRRRQRLVKRADDAGRISVIEVAFDQGEIIAGARSEPIGEIEFEL
jgi:inorganic triphosphatase YgiF